MILFLKIPINPKPASNINNAGLNSCSLTPVSGNSFLEVLWLWDVLSSLSSLRFDIFLVGLITSNVCLCCFNLTFL